MDDVRLALLGDKAAQERLTARGELLPLARAESAEARCETLEKMLKEYQDVIVPGYRDRAEKAERERDEAVEVICTHCRVLPCRGNECYWHRSQKEE